MDIYVGKKCYVLRGYDKGDISVMDINKAQVIGVTGSKFTVSYLRNDDTWSSGGRFSLGSDVSDHKRWRIFDDKNVARAFMYAMCGIPYHSELINGQYRVVCEVV